MARRETGGTIVMPETEREQACAPLPVPAGLADAVTGYCWSRDRVGESGSAVYRLHGKAGAPDLYLKQGVDAVVGAIVDEMVRLRWLAAFLPVPAIIRFLCDADTAWLLTTALPGRTAYQMLRTDPANAGPVVDAITEFLRRLHALPIDACPFNSDHRVRLRQARTRLDAGLIDIDDFDAERQGWSAAQLWDALTRHLPLTPDPVVTHGDFSLDNLLVQDGRVTGCIDVGRAGIADRYQDLAILWHCLGEFSPALQDRAWRRYGIAHPDHRKLTFHLLLDECF
jgi:aminoglycoside 3'-phosphotransferase-1